MRSIFKITLILALMLTGHVVSAGSIKCKGHIISDGTLEPVLKSTVRRKCGEPEAEKYGIDVYKSANGTRTVIRYNSAYQVQTIEKDSR